MQTLTLKKNEDRRLRRGHLWIFSNEVADSDTGYEVGEVVHVKSHSGRFLGTAYVNPHSLICGRLLSREGITVGREWIQKRITAAVSWRDRFIGGHVYRAMNAEGDGFPGLTIDRYEDVWVIQASTQGAYRWLNDITEILVKECDAEVVVLRNDSPAVELEGLERETRVLHGSVDGPVRFTLDGVEYDADVLGGQKTGFYLDQRENRLAMTPYLHDARTADLYCYSGAWALAAARGGASTVVGVDSSADAIAAASQHAALNNLSDTVSFVQAKTEDYLREQASAEQRFDVVCLDPPPFARRKADVRKALRKYESVNAMAMGSLQAEGTLITSSCSAHVGRDDFEQMLSRAAGKAKRAIQLIEWRGQSRDHPIVPAMPETAYLKCAILRVSA